MLPTKWQDNSAIEIKGVVYRLMPFGSIVSFSLRFLKPNFMFDRTFNFSKLFQHKTGFSSMKFLSVSLNYCEFNRHYHSEPFT